MSVWESSFPTERHGIRVPEVTGSDLGQKTDYPD
jgi:hypothetical protein